MYFLGALLALLAASLVQPMKSEEQKEDIWKKLISLHSLRNIKITKYFNCKFRFNSIFSRDNLPKIKDGAYVINLDDKQS